MKKFLSKILAITLALSLIAPGIAQAVDTVDLDSLERDNPEAARASIEWMLSGNETGRITHQEWSEFVDSRQAQGDPIFRGVNSGSYSLSIQETPTGQIISESSPVGGTSGQAGSGQSGLSCAPSVILASLLKNVVGGLAGAASTVLSPLVGVQNVALENKETGATFLGIPFLPSWDDILTCLGRILISYISQAAIQWVNSGFNGNPAFIQNIDKHLLRVGDQVASDFIYGIANETGLLSPYQDSLPGYIANRYLNTVGRTPLVSSAVNGNLENIFERGGRVALDSAAQFVVANNPLDTVTRAEDELRMRIYYEQERALEEARFNQGYRSQRDQYGNITTPGGNFREEVVFRGQLPLLEAIFNKTDLTRFLDQVLTGIVGQIFSGGGSAGARTRDVQPTSFSPSGAPIFQNSGRVDPADASRGRIRTSAPGFFAPAGAAAEYTEKGYWTDTR